MFPTRQCLAPGFLQKSLDHFKRQARIAVNFEGVTGKHPDYTLLDFSSPDTPSWMKVMSDKSVGGFSRASIDHIPADPATSTPAHCRFHGSISTQLPANNPRVQRTGYAAFRNQDHGMSLFGRLFWDIDPFTYLALRVKSDGRKYFVNVQTDSIVETDIHQHRLYTQEHAGANGPEDPGEWETVYIKWHEFVRTNHGTVVEPSTEMLRQKVKSVGIGLIDRVPGPFELRVERFWATNQSPLGGEKAEEKEEEAEEPRSRATIQKPMGSEEHLRV